MEASKFSEALIAFVLRQAAEGTAIGTDPSDPADPEATLTVTPDAKLGTMP